MIKGQKHKEITKHSSLEINSNNQIQRNFWHCPLDNASVAESETSANWTIRVGGQYEWVDNTSCHYVRAGELNCLVVTDPF